MSARLIQGVLAVGAIAAAGVWMSMAAARAHSPAWAAAAGLLLVLSVGGLFLIARAVVLIERRQRS